jgi:lipopolysaccharide export system permease protein
MTRIDQLLTLRVASRIGLVILVFFGIIALVESLDGWRYTYLSKEQGPEFALLAIIAAASRWSIKVLPVTVLLGAIIALLDLQNHRELVVIKASGISIWRIVRGPLIFTILFSLLISLFIDGIVTEMNRGILPVPRLSDTIVGGPGQVWVEQESEAGRFVVNAQKSGRENTRLSNATFFMPPGQNISRIQAEKAELKPGRWELQNATLRSSNKFPVWQATYNVPTTSSLADLELRLTNTDDFSFFELRDALSRGLSDPVAQAAAIMRYLKLLALPAVLVGSLLIAFAFTAGYRRTGSYGYAIVFGIVLGFIVFVITEMADRAGSAGVLDPAFAAWGPAIVAIVIGLTVLLHKEDGRA